MILFKFNSFNLVRYNSDKPYFESTKIILRKINCVLFYLKKIINIIYKTKIKLIISNTFFYTNKKIN